MTREHQQRYMEGFGAALLEEDYFGGLKPVAAAPTVKPLTNRRVQARVTLRAKSAEHQAAGPTVHAVAHQRVVLPVAVVAQLNAAKTQYYAAVAAGVPRAEAKAAANAAQRAALASVPSFYAAATAPGGAVATGPQAEGQRAGTALVKKPTYYKRRLSEEEELLLAEGEDPLITARWQAAIAKLKKGVSKRGRRMMPGTFGAIARAYGLGANLDAEERELWEESYISQFGEGQSRRGFFNRGFFAMQGVMRARRAGHTVGHPVNPYHGGGWQEDAFDLGVETAKRHSKHPGFPPDFGYDNITQWEYDKQHGGTRWGPRSMGGGYGTF